MAAVIDRPQRTSLYYRHSLPVRLMHWINVLCLTVLLMSGLQIFNAHPALYWGQRSDFAHPVAAALAQEDTHGKLTGITSIGAHRFNTTGWLGVSSGADKVPQASGFPGWATIPSYRDLATGRLWHFFFAWLFLINGLVFVLYSAASRHLSRDLLPSKDEMRHMGRSLWEHLRLHFPKGEEARRYNVIQKLTYLAVIFLLLPLVILAGLTMSPRLDAAFPVLLDLFGGRQSARTIHFIGAMAIVAFVLVHVVMVVVSGVWNNLRSMLTGRYAIEE